VRREEGRRREWVSGKYGKSEAVINKNILSIIAKSSIYEKYHTSNNANERKVHVPVIVYEITFGESSLKGRPQDTRRCFVEKILLR